MFYFQVLTLVLLAAASVNSGMSIFNVCCSINSFNINEDLVVDLRKP